MNYKIGLTTESYLLTASGEGAALIDADVVFHPTGFPMIPARRIKGMLKESLEEVLEIYDKNKEYVYEMICRLFGSPGKSTYAGKLIFNNLMYENWPYILKEVSASRNEGAFSQDFIKSYFTTEVQQTAIGKEGEEGEIEGVANKRSLRNYRVLKPNLTFEALIETTEILDTEEEDFLFKAGLNLRYAGSRRNRGFGKIKCSINKSEIGSINAINKEAEKKPLSLDVTLKTLSPVLFADLIGEQNTVFTRKYVSGNQLRGLLANSYIRKQGISPAELAHQNIDFLNLFLSGKLKFGSLTLNGGKHIPLHIHTDKKARRNDQSPQSIFSPIEKSTASTKAIDSVGFIHNGVLDTEGFEPKTTFNFHNSRLNRAAGRNLESDAEGGIFYYESLNEGQVFKGSITGDSTELALLLKSFPGSFEARAGRSRSAQYGKVKVELEPRFEASSSKMLTAGIYILSLNSSLVIFNEWGVPTPTISELNKVLSKNWGVNLEISKAASEHTFIEQFNAVWQSKSGKIAAFKEGSSFLIHIDKSLELRSESIGDMTEQGFGRYDIEKFDPDLTYTVKNVEKTILAQHSNAIIYQPDILNKLIQAYQDEESQLKVKKKAIHKALTAKPLNNHLIGRLERLFQTADSEEQVQEWIKATEGKPAWDSLKNANLLDEDKHRFLIEIEKEIIEDVEDVEDFTLQRLYWITFFQTLRKKNKQDGRN